MMLRNATSDQEQTSEKKSHEKKLVALQKQFDALQQQVELSLICPITCEIMAEPVVASDGYTYEREAIEQIINTTKISPINRTHKLALALIQNHNKKSEISSYLATHQELYVANAQRAGVYLPAAWIKELFMAIRDNKIDQVKVILGRDPRLLEYSFNPEITHLLQPYTTIQLACEQGSAEIIKYLLQLLQSKNGLDNLAALPAGFKPRYLNFLLQQTLETVAEPAFLTVLLRLGAEIEQQEIMTKNTLLHQFSRQGNLDAVRWLLSHGVALERENVAGKTALELAEANAHWGLATFLIKMGAKHKTKKHTILEFNSLRTWDVSIGVRSQGTTAFLQHVVNGEQEQAAAMLQVSPALGLLRGNVTDHAGRIFKDITGFQYAVWALDWDMWRMIKVYLSDAAAKAQADKFMDSAWEVSRTHGYYFKIQPLITAMETYINNYYIWNSDQLKSHWINVIGREQKKLPIHMLQQYCNRQRSLVSVPDFESSTEVMSRKLDVDLSLLGLTRAISFGGRSWLYGDLQHTKCDMRVLELLFITRIKQREELRAATVVGRTTPVASTSMRRSRTAI